MIEQTIAHYRVTGKLGEGGVGDVAIKVLPTAIAANMQSMARFAREAFVSLTA